VDDDGGSGSGVGQRWMMTRMTTATAAVEDHGGAPPLPPPPSLLANALASLSLPALSLAFGLPLLAFSRSNTATTADAPSSSDRPPRGGHIRRHRRDGNGRDDFDNGRHRVVVRHQGE